MHRANLDSKYTCTRKYITAMETENKLKLFRMNMSLTLLNEQSNNSKMSSRSQDSNTICAI